MSDIATDERRGLPSASGIARLAACPGSYRMAKGIPDRPTDDGDFGTAIHAYLAGTLKAEDLTGEQLDIAESCSAIEARLVNQWKTRCLLTDHEITVTRDSERLWLSLDGEPACSGVADVVYRYKDVALALDYKTLPGEHADSDENLQLRTLAVLTDEKYDLSMAIVDVAIIQPLVTHSPTVSRYDVEALGIARSELLTILEAAKAPDAPLHPGKQCDYCRAASICPEVHREVTHMSIITLQEEGGLAVPDEVMAKLGERCGAALKMISNIKADIRRRVEADPASWRALGWELREGAGKRAVTNVGKVAERLEGKGCAMPDIAAACSITIGNVKTLARAATGAKGMGLEKIVDAILEDCITLKVPKPSLKRIGMADDDEE